MFTSARQSIRRSPGKALAALTGGLALVAITGGGVAAAGATGPGAGPGPAKPAAPPASAQNLGSYTRVVGSTVTLTAGGYASATASCPAGQIVLGGGESNTAPGTLVITDSWPSSTSTWLVYVKSSATTSYSFTVYALCGT
jgi:hypothetical protein